MNLNNPVWEIMTSDLTTVSDTDSIEKLKPLLKRRSIHHLPVEDEEGTLLGIISSEDFARAAFFPVPENKLLAKHIMTVSVEAVDMGTPIRKVIDLFMENRYRAIPVVDIDKILIGIVTPYDIMKVLMASYEPNEMDAK